MNLKERRLLNKIQKLHYKLVCYLAVGDEKELEINELFVKYYNNLNLTILDNELKKEVK